MKKIGIIGGTFDPPHFGHLIIAQEVLESFCLDEIWFMPSAIPPHKDREDILDANTRLELLKRAIADHPQFSVSTIELERSGKSYTYDTMKQLKERYPDTLFYFLIGGDMIDSLHTWYEIEQLLELVQFIGLRRPGYVSKSRFSERILEIEVPQIDISSSLIRNRIRAGKSIRYFVPEQVRTYIEMGNLYGAT